MRAEAASLCHIRDGNVSRLLIDYERERAFSDLGLASGAEPPVLIAPFRSGGLRATKVALMLS